MAQTKGTTALSESLMSADGKEVFGVSGMWSKKLFRNAEENPLYVFKKRCRGGMKGDLYSGPEPVGEPLVTVRHVGNRRSSEAHGRRPIKITSRGQEGAEITAMYVHGFFSMDRRFSISGEEYQWRRVGSFFSTLRFVLEHVSGGEPNTVLAEYTVSFWTGKGSFTIHHTKQELPREVLLATGLAMEANRHE